MHDDYAPPASEWKPTIHPLLSYTAVYDGGEVIGMFIVAAHSDILWELHEAFLPYAWGERAKRAAIEFREWIWKETGCQRLIGAIPRCYRLALKYAKAGGMEEVGVHPRCFMKNGALEDLIVVGVSRPEGK